MSTCLRHTAVTCVIAVALAGTVTAAAQSGAPSQAVIPAPSVVPGPTTQPMPDAAATSPGATADPASTPPASVQWVEPQVAKYRSEVEARVARGDMNPVEAERLIGWRRWQLQQQAAGQAPESQIIERQNAADRARRDVVVVPSPRTYYRTYPSPYYAPYYGGWYGSGYAPYVPGVSLCAGGAGRHYSAAMCF